MNKIMKYFLTVLIFLFLFSISSSQQSALHAAEAQLKALPKSEKHRIVVLTDIGGDLDDMQSFTRWNIPIGAAGVAVLSAPPTLKHNG